MMMAIMNAVRLVKIQPQGGDRDSNIVRSDSVLNRSPSTRIAGIN